MFGNKPVDNSLPLVSRARLITIDFESQKTGDGTTNDPTEEERRWSDMMKQTVPELEKIRKKISVCALAEIVSYDKDHLTFAYEGEKYTLNKPTNSLRIARAREYSIMSALEELNAQRCITSNGVPIQKDFSGIDSEVISLMGSLAERFFFMPFL